MKSQEKIAVNGSSTEYAVPTELKRVAAAVLVMAMHGGADGLVNLNGA